MVVDPQTTPASQRWVSPVIVSTLSALLLVPRLGRFGLVADEGFSVSTSVRPWGSLFWLSLERETNGFLYAIFLKIWSSGGLSESWLRLPSALSVAATVALTCMLGRRLHGDVVGIVAALIVAVNGTVVQFGQNIRFYAPVMAVAVGFALICHCYLARPNGLMGMTIVMVGIALPCLHLVSGALLVAMVVVALCWQRFWRISLLVAPGLVVAVALGVVVSNRDEGQSINLPFGRAAVADVLFSLTGSAGLLGLVTFGLLGTVAMVGLWKQYFFLHHQELLPVSHRQTVQTKEVATALFPWTIVATVLGLVLIGSQFTPIMVGRYVIYLIPFCAIGIAAGLVQACRPVFRSTPLAKRRLGGVVLPAATREPLEGVRLLYLVTVAGLCLLSVIGTGAGAAKWILDDDREEWRSLSRTLLDEGRPGDSVLFANDSMRLFVEYELLRFPERAALAPKPLFPSGEWGTFGTGDQSYTPFSSEDVQKALNSSSRVWLVVERPLLDKSSNDSPLMRAISHGTFSGRLPKLRGFGRAGVLYRIGD